MSYAPFRTRAYEKFGTHRVPTQCETVSIRITVSDFPLSLKGGHGSVMEIKPGWFWSEPIHNFVYYCEAEVREARVPNYIGLDHNVVLDEHLAKKV